MNVVSWAMSFSPKCSRIIVLGGFNDVHYEF